ncbi:hypothetical protein ACWF94_30695, partial [Streptomyces sp. NPDC055078]
APGRAPAPGRPAATGRTNATARPDTTRRTEAPARTALAEGNRSVQPSTRADDLVRISLALRRSPLVNEARSPTAPTESSNP